MIVLRPCGCGFDPAPFQELISPCRVGFIQALLPATVWENKPHSSPSLPPPTLPPPPRHTEGKDQRPDGMGAVPVTRCNRY